MKQPYTVSLSCPAGPATSLQPQIYKKQIKLNSQQVSEKSFFATVLSVGLCETTLTNVAASLCRAFSRDLALPSVDLGSKHAEKPIDRGNRLVRMMDFC